MGLRRLLEDPNGGQLFSAWIVLLALLGLCGFLAVNLIAKLLQGEAIEINRDGVVPLVATAFLIPALIKFVRSRHAR